MAPSGRPRTRRATAARKPKRRATQIKKRTNPSRKEEKSADLSPSCKTMIIAGANAAAEADASSGGCSTPKGQQFEIPEMMTCPPAPKKRRPLSNCSLRRSPISFFAPPEIELFFFMALRRDIQV